jgi:tetratricopeptide (TPR) repeat protein
MKKPDSIQLPASGTALYDYSAQRNDELSFKRDDTFIIHKVNANGWWEVERNERRGVVPGNYIYLYGKLKPKAAKPIPAKTDEALFKMAADFYNKGIAKAKSERYEEAIEDYTQAILIKPDYASAYNSRGGAKFDLGNYEGALEDYSQALQFKPDSDSYYYNCAAARRRLAQYWEAIKDYTQSLRLAPTKAQAYCYRGLVKSYLDRHEEAINDYLQALELDPGCVNALANLGMSYLLQRDFNHAQKYFDAALNIYKYCIRALQGTAIIYLQQEKQVEAESIFQEITQYYRDKSEKGTIPEQLDLYQDRAKAFIILGFNKLAQEAITKGLSLKKGYVPLMELEKQLNPTTTMNLSESAAENQVSSSKGSQANTVPPVITAIALCDYAAKRFDELSFKKNDKLTILKKLPGIWWRAELDGQEGTIPSDSVKIESGLKAEPIKKVNAVNQQTNKKESISTPTSAISINGGNSETSPIKKRQAIPALALNDYTAKCSGEISFKTNDSLLILEQSSDGWWYAKLQGQRGKVPSHYMQLNTLPSASKTTRYTVSNIPVIDINNFNITRINAKNLEYVQYHGNPIILGSGRYGTVYEGVYKAIFDKPFVAIKTLDKLNESNLNEVFDEVSIMQRIDSSFTVYCYGLTIQPYNIVMEYMAGGTLKSLLYGTDKPLTWKAAYQICLDVSYAINYLHEHGIVHGDLKHDNILFDERQQAVIADFGGAKIKTFLSPTLFGESLFGKKVGGSLNYLAPELWQELQIIQIQDKKLPDANKEVVAGFSPEAKTTEASDIYSLGRLFWEITSRQAPFSKELLSSSSATRLSDFKALITKKELLEEPINSKTPLLLKGTMQRCWFRLPGERPSSTQVVNEIEKGADTLSTDFIKELIAKPGS